MTRRRWIILAIVVVALIVVALNPDFQAGIRDGLDGAGR
jgi:hypothetical protein